MIGFNEILDIVELAVILRRRGTPLPSQVWRILMRPDPKLPARLDINVPIPGGSTWRCLRPRGIINEVKGLDAKGDLQSLDVVGLGPESAWPYRLTPAEIVPLAFADDACLALRFEFGQKPGAVVFGPVHAEEWAWVTIDLDALLALGRGVP